MLGLRKGVSHRKRPDGKLPAPVIIVNFGVAAPWSPGNGVTVQASEFIRQEGFLENLWKPATFFHPKPVAEEGGQR